MPSIQRSLLALLGLAWGAAHAQSAVLSKPGLEIAREIPQALRARILLHLHNLANVDAWGYKRILPRSIDSPAAGAWTPAPGDQDRDWGQGVIEHTGRALDLAIEGPGFFRVSDPEGGFAYTRCGNLVVDDAGNLATRAGFPLSPALKIPSFALSVTVDRRGGVWILTEADRLLPARVGTIVLYVVAAPAGLSAWRSDTFRPTPASGPARALRRGEVGNEHASPLLIQHALERSNVVWAEELLHLQAACMQLLRLGRLGR